MSAGSEGKKIWPIPASGAPPEGVTGSEQLVENGMWRVQLDLSTGGVRSLLLRGRGEKRELADPDGAIHPFQGVLRDPVGGLAAASQYIRSRFRFDEEGASLSVVSSLAGGEWKTTFRVKAGDPVLGVDLEWANLTSGSALEMALPLAMPGSARPGWRSDGADGMSLEGRDFRVTASGNGMTWRPQREVAELASAAGSAQMTLRAV
jgi:hypothetical protein